jgi:ribose 5-phosphate isomerase B
VRVYLGSDHAGFELKGYLLRRLRGAGHEAVDVGPHAYREADDYPPYCVATAIWVAGDRGSLGVVIGGSGNGEQIAANKVPGVRAALGWSPEIARLARAHNDALVLAIGARMHTAEQAAEMVETFLGTEFGAEARHARRIGMLSDYERTRVPPALPQE